MRLKLSDIKFPFCVLSILSLQEIASFFRIFEGNIEKKAKSMRHFEKNM